jgi:hypothetical protein
MIKMLFLDWRYYEEARGIRRVLEPPTVHETPVLVSDQPWERNYIVTYGSVARRKDGVFQLWYTCGRWSEDGLRPAYAESEDGIVFRRPELGLVEKDGRPTNLVMDRRLIGLSVILDEAEERDERRYKMLAGAGSSPRLSAFGSGDGKRWLPIAENPVQGVNPDGPVGLFRGPDGRYVAYHRPCWGDRRIARSDSWDFVHWSEPRVVLEPESGDGTNVQFYGLGAIPYGPYVLGTLWVYHTDPQCLGWTKSMGRTHPELVYGRGGYAWHRAMLGRPWIANAETPDECGYGLVQTVSSPLLLEDEIRFYFTRCYRRHGEDRQARTDRPEYEVCFARSRPDRFVGGDCRQEASLLTRPFWHENPRFFVNARCRPGGYVKAAIVDVEAQPIPGFELDTSVQVEGDELAGELRWRGDPDYAQLAGTEIRIRLEASEATLFSLAAASSDELGRYDVFSEPHFLPKDLETYARPRQ